MDKSQMICMKYFSVGGGSGWSKSVKLESLIGFSDIDITSYDIDITS